MKKALHSISDFSGMLLNRIEKNSWVYVHQLASFRIFFGIFLLFSYTPKWRWLGEVPSTFFNPPLLSIANLFQDFPPRPVFYTLDFVFYVLLIFITLGIKSRISLFLAFLLGVFANSFAFSFGKIDHTIMIWICLVIMAFTNSGTRYALWKDRVWPEVYQRKALGCLSIFIAFGMFTAGFQKSYNWIDFDLSTSGFLRWFYSNYFIRDRQDLLADLVFQFPVIVTELMDYTAVLFEISGFFFLLWGRISWRMYLLVAALFHLMNVLLLNIDFRAHIPVYGLFLLSPILYVFFKRLRAVKFLKEIFITLVLVKGVLLLIPIILEGSNIQLFSSDDLRLHESVFYWSIVLALSFYSFKNKLYLINGNK